MEEGKNQGVYQTERTERKRADFYRLSCVWSNWTIIDHRAPFVELSCVWSNRENYHRLHEEFEHAQSL